MLVFNELMFKELVLDELAFNELVFNELVFNESSIFFASLKALLLFCVFAPLSD